MARYDDFYKARDKITEIMAKDFIGPVSSEEVLAEEPSQYYIMGKIYPQGTNEEDLDLTGDLYLENALENYDSSVSLSNQSNPSSVGITCTLKKGVKNLKILVQFAMYMPKEVALSEEKVKTDDEVEKKTGLQWERKAYSCEKIIDFTTSSGKEVLPLMGGMQLHVYTPMIFDSGERVITVALVNGNVSGKDRKEKNSKTAFQPRIKIIGTDQESIFVSVDKKVHLSSDKELLELELLYHDVICYAQGHGCAVDWDKEHVKPMWVQTSFFPMIKVPQMKATEFVDLKVFNIKHLYTESSQVIIMELRQFVNLYKNWINGIAEKTKAFEDDKRNSALENIKKCTAACQQISKTIDLLEKSAAGNKIAYRAFQLANEAMFMQRVQTLKRGYRTINEKDINWYPFQLAFILHEIISFIEPQGEARKKVDLLWFPTGGGKTEAYLGISAFVIFLRRLKNSQSDGVTVMMRYTLRLLTIQQFERASILIFACEKLRVKYKLGGKEITIGLWVGDKLVPNDLSVAATALNKLAVNGRPSYNLKDPCVLKVCPWCGADLGPQDYKVDKIAQRMLIVCPNENCEFHKRALGLPVHLIDDAIYEHVPTFIVSTIDKFAQIPLNDKPATLFGITNHKLPPELIIQDELHLISGPLGTITGLYEAAITKFCEHDGVKAKVIASTATIRNAANQIKALYGRSATQFPPQGITIKDSFFAKEAKPNERPERLYCGVMGVGTTATTTLIKVNAALLFATRYLELLGLSDQVVDNYWTLVEYFNSLRELGGAYTQILDSVQSRFEYLAKTKFKRAYPGVNAKETYNKIAELTSRLKSGEISEIIQKSLKNTYHKNNRKKALHFVLASNMISVGIDVGRLGNMVVAGQPKTNAEYIQATSRVGRDNPGLVVIVLNPSRSRDRSHYEQFAIYHRAMYRYVEATSLTPFADRARDKGLQALFIGLCRYLVPGLLKDSDAGNFSINEDVEKIAQYICDYVKIVDKSELVAVEKELNDIANEWAEEADDSLVYKNKQDGKTKLLKPDIANHRFSIMNSMRNVDNQASVYLCRRS